ncbi:hypothetical protein IQ07DRAFT_639531 [Pyrenochaeta sp. DS3sAY3a]|nr:hypothetical protein IQ07DRAFT_639531 [Pyrenochaeta sp. DS3sAY3a]
MPALIQRLRQRFTTRPHQTVAPEPSPSSQRHYPYLVEHDRVLLDGPNDDSPRSSLPEIVDRGLPDARRYENADIYWNSTMVEADEDPIEERRRRRREAARRNCHIGEQNPENTVGEQFARFSFAPASRKGKEKAVSPPFAQTQQAQAFEPRESHGRGPRGQQDDLIAFLKDDRGYVAAQGTKTQAVKGGSLVDTSTKIGPSTDYEKFLAAQKGDAVQASSPLGQESPITAFKVMLEQPVAVAEQADEKQKAAKQEPSKEEPYLNSDSGYSTNSKSKGGVPQSNEGIPTSKRAYSQSEESFHTPETLKEAPDRVRSLLSSLLTPSELSLHYQTLTNGSSASSSPSKHNELTCKLHTAIKFLHDRVCHLEDNLVPLLSTLSEEKSVKINELSVERVRLIGEVHVLKTLVDCESKVIEDCLTRECDVLRALAKIRSRRDVPLARGWSLGKLTRRGRNSRAESQCYGGTSANQDLDALRRIAEENAEELRDEIEDMHILIRDYKKTYRKRAVVERKRVEGSWRDV